MNRKNNEFFNQNSKHHWNDYYESNSRYDEDRFFSNKNYSGKRGGLSKDNLNDNRGRYNHDHKNDKKCLICKIYCLKGNCRYGKNCWSLHLLRLIKSFEHAHDSSIISSSIGLFKPSSYEFFTGGKDKMLKRWVIEKSSETFVDSLFPSDASVPNNLDQDFKISLVTSTSMSSPITKIFLKGDLLVCGLLSGEICVYERLSNSSIILPAHKSEVQALILIDKVLISGGFEGLLKFWSPAVDVAGNPVFNCVHTMDAGFKIKTLYNIEDTRCVIVGGINAVSLYNLETFQILALHRLGQPNSICMEIIKCDTIYLAIFSCGYVAGLNVHGHLVSNWNINTLGFIISVVGVQSPNGPRLLLGNNKGELECVDIANNMQICWSFKAHEDQIRELVTTEDFTITVSSDSNIKFWKLTDGSDNIINISNKKYGRYEQSRNRPRK